jgi:hypothetical protein
MARPAEPVDLEGPEELEELEELEERFQATEDSEALAEPEV